MDASVDFAASARRWQEAENPTTSHLSGPIRIAYILGATHSGSTVLAIQLARHPDVCTIGELSGTRFRAEPGYRCSCGSELVKCGFWQRVSAAMAKRGFSYSATTAETDVRNAPNGYARWLLGPMHRGPFFESLRDAALQLSPASRAYLRHHQRLKTALVESVLECTGRPVLVNSSKLGVQLKYHLRNPRFDVKVIWLVRDGRAVACSLMRHEGVAIEQAAYQWRRFYSEAEAIVRRLDRSQWTRARYETLCTDPDRTLSELWQFMGLPARAPESASSSDFHVLGHQTRLSGFENLRLNEKWRAELSAGDLRRFDAVAGRMNRELGYR